MKRVVMACSLLLLTLAVSAQSPVGKWKYQLWATYAADGKKTDILKDFVKEYPCMPTSWLEFTSAGKIVPHGGTCPKDMHTVFGIKWSIPSSGKITIDLGDEQEPDLHTYDIELKGNTMRWTMSFPESKDTRRLEIIFTKL
jgi:hypothetical protein